ncbi:MAG: hypothetical protein BEN18_04925 [Epulopiscium sp. Nuni2H_MBin001]|nr:MAG: hypothetical protein BEN18_04925 [Epulopiscium sp. Nuni2H_MBin001]
MSDYLGIDLGTTNSVVSHFNNGQLRRVKFDNQEIIPSAMFFHSADKIYYGNMALRRMHQYPHSGIKLFKRMLYNPQSFKEIIYQNSPHSQPLQLTGKLASTMFLTYLREHSSTQFNVDFRKAVVTVPDNFNTTQVELTKLAAIDAGFHDVIMLKEPIAASIVYGLTSQVDKNILVYDFGGGTFDVSIINIGQQCEVIATGGDSNLGGEDITLDIVQYLCEKIEDDYNLFLLEPSEKFEHNQRILYDAAEKLKISLSEFDEQEVCFSVYASDNNVVTINYNITRQELEDEVLRAINGKATQIVRKVLRDADLLVDDIDIVALAGGSSCIPVLQQGIANALGKSPHTTQSLATVVADGAAIRGGDGQIQKVILENVIHDFGVRIGDATFDALIKVGQRLPAKAVKCYRPTAANQRVINIDIFARESGCLATRTFEDGITFLDNIRFENLPECDDMTKLCLEITFEINKEYYLNKLETKLYDVAGNEICSKNLKCISVNQSGGATCI